MTFGLSCHCDQRSDIDCTETVCEIAGRGAPGNANSCRICWLRLQRWRIEHEGLVVINHAGGGIGDALLGLTAVTAFRRNHPNRHIDYRVPRHALPFARLFDGGYDTLSAHGDGISTHEIDRDYGDELRTRCAVPRWLRYCRNLGLDEPVLPTLHARENLRERGKAYRGVIVLAPFSSERLRDYPHMDQLEAVLLAQGHRAIILHHRANRLRLFRGEKIISENAETLASVLLNARCVIGGDTGMMHLAGIMGQPAIVLSGPTRGEDIYGFYPRVRFLNGSLDCTGCFWQHPHSGACHPRCPALSSICPQDVLALVESL